MVVAEDVRIVDFWGYSLKGDLRHKWCDKSGLGNQLQLLDPTAQDSWRTGQRDHSMCTF